MEHKKIVPIYVYRPKIATNSKFIFIYLARQIAVKKLPKNLYLLI